MYFLVVMRFFFCLMGAVVFIGSNVRYFWDVFEGRVVRYFSCIYCV